MSKAGSGSASHVLSPRCCNLPTGVGYFQHARPCHPKKDVEKTLQYAEEHHFDVGHVWGVLRCQSGICILRVAGTPKNEGNEAKRIRRFVGRCEHEEKD